MAKKMSDRGLASSKISEEKKFDIRSEGGRKSKGGGRPKKSDS